MAKFGATGFPAREDGDRDGGGGGRCGHGADCLDELVVRFDEEWKAEDFVRLVDTYLHPMPTA